MFILLRENKCCYALRTLQQIERGTDAPFRTSALIKPLMEVPDNRDTEYLNQLADQLKIDKTPACRRAINRILAEVKARCDSGEYDNPMAAESAFRKFVEDDRTRQKAKTAVELS